MRHFIDICDFDTKEINKIIHNAKKIKKNPKKYYQICQGKTLGMIFQKESTRTRVSFSVGFQKLGGYSLELNADKIGFGKRESYEDVIKTLSQFVNILMISKKSLLLIIKD